MDVVMIEEQWVGIRIFRNGQRKGRMKGRKGQFGVICIIIHRFIANKHVILRMVRIIMNSFSMMGKISIRNILYEMAEIGFQTMLYDGETRYNPIKWMAFRF
jgi:hypothetical protein